MTGNIYCGLHEFTEMAFVLHMLREGDVFVDVGANSGSYTVLACGAAGASGIALEPGPAAHARLVDNVRLNRLEGRVECLNVAAADEEGMLRFTDGLDTVNHVLSRSEGPAGFIEVRAERLDDILADRSPALMKIDVEGYEAAVLMGSENALSSERLLAVVIEITGCDQKYGFEPSRPHAMLLEKGFERYLYDPLTRELAKLSPANGASSNCLYIRDINLVGQRVASAPGYRVLGQVL